MYYHRRPLEHVVYGKVYPPPESLKKVYWRRAYRWLGQHCGFCPQVWLSRGSAFITGFRLDSSFGPKGWEGASRKKVWQSRTDNALFGFENIQGFPLSYDHWLEILCAVSHLDDFAEQNAELVSMFNENLEDYRDPDDADEPVGDWLKSGCDLEVFLRDFVFQKYDQVVVPSLNLKSAKQIICRNERQKKILRRMGFIEDRIVIRNVEPITYPKSRVPDDDQEDNPDHDFEDED